MSRAAPLVAWILLVAVAFGGAPDGARPDQTAWLLRLLTGDWAGENPMVVAHFQLMGLWPLAFALLLRRHWRDRPVPAWPFLLGSLALGCFVLLPWFATRAEPISLPDRSPWLVATGGALGLVAAGFLAWGLLAGDVAAWWQGVRTDSFLWAMSWDFLAFTLLLVVTLARRVRG